MRDCRRVLSDVWTDNEDDDSGDDSDDAAGGQAHGLMRLGTGHGERGGGGREVERRRTPAAGRQALGGGIGSEWAKDAGIGAKQVPLPFAPACQFHLPGADADADANTSTNLAGSASCATTPSGQCPRTFAPMVGGTALE